MDGWINVGISMYITINRKPENGCEIQNAACGKSGVVICMIILKSDTVKMHYL